MFFLDSIKISVIVGRSNILHIMIKLHMNDLFFTNFLKPIPKLQIINFEYLKHRQFETPISQGLTSNWDNFLRPPYDPRFQWEIG